jgi:hypothetical protein
VWVSIVRRGSGSGASWSSIDKRGRAAFLKGTSLLGLYLSLYGEKTEKNLASIYFCTRIGFWSFVPA